MLYFSLFTRMFTESLTSCRSFQKWCLYLDSYGSWGIWCKIWADNMFSPPSPWWRLQQLRWWRIMWTAVALLDRMWLCTTTQHKQGSKSSASTCCSETAVSTTWNWWHILWNRNSLEVFNTFKLSMNMWFEIRKCNYGSAAENAVRAAWPVWKNQFATVCYGAPVAWAAVWLQY